MSHIGSRPRLYILWSFCLTEYMKNAIKHMFQCHKMQISNHLWSNWASLRTQRRKIGVEGGSSFYDPTLLPGESISFDLVRMQVTALMRPSLTRASPSRKLQITALSISNYKWLLRLLITHCCDLHVATWPVHRLMTKAKTKWKTQKVMV